MGNPIITRATFSSFPRRKPALKVGTRKHFLGTGIKKGWYILQFMRYHDPMGRPIGYVSNGRGGLRTEWVLIDPQPETSTDSAVKMVV